MIFFKNVYFYDRIFKFNSSMTLVYSYFLYNPFSFVSQNSLKYVFNQDLFFRKQEKNYCFNSKYFFIFFIYYYHYKSIIIIDPAYEINLINQLQKYYFLKFYSIIILLSIGINDQKLYKDFFYRNNQCYYLFIFHFLHFNCFFSA